MQLLEIEEVSINWQKNQLIKLSFKTRKEMDITCILIHLAAFKILRILFNLPLIAVLEFSVDN